MKKLMCYDRVILDTSFRHKSRLQGGDDLGENNFQSVGQNLCDDLVGDVTETYRSKLVHCMSTTLFRNQGDECMIQLT
jgi:hypothetical protein